MALTGQHLKINKELLITLFDKVFPDGDHIGLFPAKTLLDIPRNDLRALCALTARYGVVTKEAVDFLRDNMDMSSTIEIGAGMGDWSHHLGITGTDSAVQARPEYASIYLSLGQAPINPPPSIHRLEALEAVRVHKPNTVLGVWVTQRFDAAAGDKEGIAQSFVEGVDEEKLFCSGIKRYIMIGNTDQHAKKRIMKYPHKVYSFPWLVSRAANHQNNRIWIWDL